MIWARAELRVLFVCTANVCRSPLAEGLLRHHLRAMGLESRVLVRSAGSCAAQRGRQPDPRVVKLAAGMGVSLERIRTRPLTARMIHHSDYILVMEQHHLNDVAQLYGGADVPENVQLLGSFLPAEAVSASDIPDPYFSDWQGLVDVFDLIDTALVNFIPSLKRRLEIS